MSKPKIATFNILQVNTIRSIKSGLLTLLIARKMGKDLRDFDKGPILMANRKAYTQVQGSLLHNVFFFFARIAIWSDPTGELLKHKLVK